MRAIVVLAAAMTACAQTQRDHASQSVVPGTIRVVVQKHGAAVMVAAVGKESPAAQSGVRVGDLVLRYNGEPVTSPRQFYQLVVESPPGSVARLEVLRAGSPRMLELPVEQLDLLPPV